MKTKLVGRRDTTTNTVGLSGHDRKHLSHKYMYELFNLLLHERKHNFSYLNFIVTLVLCIYLLTDIETFEVFPENAFP